VAVETVLHEIAKKITETIAEATIFNRAGVISWLHFITMSAMVCAKYLSRPDFALLSAD
jgi:hypothetical protein